MSMRAALVWTLLAALLGGVWLAFALSEKSGPSGSSRLFAPSWRDVIEIRLLRGGIPAVEMIDFKPVDANDPLNDRWTYRVNQGRADEVDPQAIEELKALVNLAQRRAAGPAAAPVDPSTADQLVLVDRDRREHGVYVAPVDSDAPDRRITTTSAPDDALQVAGDLFRVLDRSADEWRRLDLFDLSGGRQPFRLELSPGAGLDVQEPVALEREPGGSWHVVRPVRWPADPTEVERLLRLCQALRAKEAAASDIDAEAASGFGVGPESAALTLTTRDPAGREAAQTVRFGRIRGDGSAMYARVEGRAPLFWAPADLSVDFARAHALQEPGRPNAWADRYRLKTLPLIANPLRPPPGGVSVTAPGGMLMRLRPLMEGEMLEGAPPLPLMPPGPDGAPQPPPAPWLAEIRAPDGRLTDRFPLDSRRRDELFVTLATMRTAEFLPAPADPAAHDAGRRVWRVATLDAAGNELLHARLLEFPGEAPVDPLPDGRAGPPDAARSPALEAAIVGYAERARIGAGPSGYIGQPFYRYRDRHVAALDYEKLTWLTIEWDGKRRGWRRDGKNIWRQVEPEDAPIIDDQHQMLQTILLLSRLEAIDWVAWRPERLVDYGLDPEQGRVRAGGGDGSEDPTGTWLDIRLGTAPLQWGFLPAGGEAFEVVAGSAAGERNVQAPRPEDFPPVYAAVADRPEVFLLYGGVLERLLRDYH